VLPTQEDPKAKIPEDTGGGSVPIPDPLGTAGGGPGLLRVRPKGGCCTDLGLILP